MKPNSEWEKSVRYHLPGTGPTGALHKWYLTLFSRLFILFFSWSQLWGPAVCLAETEIVRAELKQKSAWTGEGVSMSVTLYSPGPFSGTPSFDLPHLPTTAIVKSAGSPLIGNETIGDDSWFTQRHEFSIYTQQTGVIVIPAFRVRFAGKKSFTGDAEPMQGESAELRFSSKRPPGTEQLGMVVAAASMEVSQTWKPQDPETVNAGDVIERNIMRRATETSAMMFAPIQLSPIDDVRIYPGEPTVQDHEQRGADTAQRKDTFKYQFAKPGQYVVPDLSIVWWDTTAEKLQHETLAGVAITVHNTPLSADAAAELSHRYRRGLVVLVVLITLAVWLTRRPLRRTVTRWWAWRREPSHLAARQLLAACRMHDAPAACMALTAWKQTSGFAREDSCRAKHVSTSLVNEFQKESAELLRRVYGGTQSQAAWRGERLAVAFHRIQSAMVADVETPEATRSLPRLNP